MARTERLERPHTREIDAAMRGTRVHTAGEFHRGRIGANNSAICAPTMAFSPGCSINEFIAQTSLDALHYN